MKGIKFNKIARISLVILLILSAIQIIPFEIELAEKASAGSTWHETDWSGAGSFNAAKSVDNSSSPGNLKLVKDTYLYIADSFNHRIVKTKINGDGWTTYGTFGTGVGQFSSPSAISYDNTTGYIYVADRANDRIVKTKIDGSGWTSWGTQGPGINEFSDPYGIHYDRDTEFIYVGDTNNHRLVKTQINGNGWQTYGTEGNGTGQFDLLMGVDFDNSSGMEYVYISDYNNHRMVKTNMTGFGWTTLGDTDNPGNGTGQFNWPIGIDIDNSTGTEWIYVGDSQNHRIVKTQMNDSGWTTLGGPISGTGVGKFWSPRG
ncbi:MAG: NHL repeat-containing protein, partial [Thermoplasmata archaeon]|nr:NHL repeat-containing protein [Thermoplasmata archaeon]